MQDESTQQEYEFTVIIEQDEDGAYLALCPALPGCHSVGDTEDEAREMIVGATSLYVEHLRDRGEPVPPDMSVTKLQIGA